eukprot:9728119-Alexandrium_andersonii.AAC.1
MPTPPQQSRAASGCVGPSTKSLSCCLARPASAAACRAGTPCSWNATTPLVMTSSKTDVRAVTLTE